MQQTGLIISRSPHRHLGPAMALDFRDSDCCSVHHKLLDIIRDQQNKTKQNKTEKKEQGPCYKGFVSTFHVELGNNVVTLLQM